jgi:3',5'-cyclic AMP phosphodiesterase CpdA
MPGRWYAAQLGDVLFVALDSTMAEDPGQLTWLEQTLAASNNDWVIAEMHHPPLSAGIHGSDEDTREAFVPLFEKYGVDLVLAGHDHDYQRSIPIGGVTYIVSGAGAKVRSAGSADFAEASAAVLHFVEIGIWDDRPEITAISLDGVFDSVELTRDRSATPAAVAFPLSGFLSDTETLAGARVASAGAFIWLFTSSTMSTRTVAYSAGQIGIDQLGHRSGRDHLHIVGLLT